MDDRIQKMIEEITREVISRASAAEAGTDYMPRQNSSIGRGSAYDLGPYADEMRRMMAERGSRPVSRPCVGGGSAGCSTSGHHGSAFDYGTRL